MSHKRSRPLVPKSSTSYSISQSSSSSSSSPSKSLSSASAQTHSLPSPSPSPSPSSSYPSYAESSSPYHPPPSSSHLSPREKERNNSKDKETDSYTFPPPSSSSVKSLNFLALEQQVKLEGIRQNDITREGSERYSDNNNENNDNDPYPHKEEFPSPPPSSLSSSSLSVSLSLNRQFPHYMKQYQYELVRPIGRGTFSEVYLAKTKNNEFLAIKRLKSTCHISHIMNEIDILKQLDGKDNAVTLLHVIAERIDENRNIENKENENENHFNISPPPLSMSLPPSSSPHSVSLVFPYYESVDFNSIFRDFDIFQIQHFMRNLLESLRHTESQNVIHRDLKPANFLVIIKGGYPLFKEKYSAEKLKGNAMECLDDHCSYRLIDFGLATLQGKNTTQIKKHYEKSNSLEDRMKHFVKEKTQKMVQKQRESGDVNVHIHQDESQSMDHSVRKRKSLSDSPVDKIELLEMPKVNHDGTRGFRAPETLLEVPYESTAIDMWAAGVILLTLMAKCSSVFTPKPNPWCTVVNGDDQLSQYLHLLGMPKRKARQEMDRKIHKWPNSEGIPSHSILSLIRFISFHSECYWPYEMYEILSQLLEWSPKSRITANKALEHNFITTNWRFHDKENKERGELWKYIRKMNVMMEEIEKGEREMKEENAMLEDEMEKAEREKVEVEKQLDQLYFEEGIQDEEEGESDGEAEEEGKRIKQDTQSTVETEMGKQNENDPHVSTPSPSYYPKNEDTIDEKRVDYEKSLSPSLSLDSELFRLSAEIKFLNEMYRAALKNKETRGNTKRSRGEKKIKEEKM